MVTLLPRQLKNVYSIFRVYLGHAVRLQRRIAGALVNRTPTREFPGFELFRMIAVHVFCDQTGA